MKKGTTKPDEQMHAHYRKCRVNGIQMHYHRHVMEVFLGRSLLHSESVHHINGNPYDNRIENLEVMTSCAHNTMHGLMYKHSEETKAKMSKLLIGNQRHKGIPLSPEAKAKLSVFRTGNHFPSPSEETKLRISASMREARKKKFWSTRKKDE
jgi:hypothetical protein